MAAKSAVMAAGRRERLQAEGHGFDHTSYGELLYRDGHERRARRASKAVQVAQEMSAAREEAELAECTFTPNRITSSKRGQQLFAHARGCTVTGMAAPAGKQPEPGEGSSILERTEAFQRKKKETRAALQACAEEAELQECTFTPVIQKRKARSRAGGGGVTRESGMDRIEQIVRESEARQHERQRQVAQDAAMLRRMAVPEINANSRRQVLEARLKRTTQQQRHHIVRGTVTLLRTCCETHPLTPFIADTNLRSGWAAARRA
jgi:hypothetical protein